MYQGYDGQWYDDNRTPLGYYPGYSPADTATGDPNAGDGSQPQPPPQFPTTTTGGFPRTIGPAVTQGPGNLTPDIAQPNPDAPTTDWSSLQTSIFGAQPSVPSYPAFDYQPFSYDPFNAPAPFAPPSANDVLFSDPGYGFRRDQGTQALQQSAAARGVLNTGGTLQDLINYGQNAASQEYGNAFNRAAGTYQMNYNDLANTYNTNRGNAFNNYLSNLGLALTKYNTNFGTQVQYPFEALTNQYRQGVQNQGQLFGQQFQTATS